MFPAFRRVHFYLAFIDHVAYNKNNTLLRDTSYAPLIHKVIKGLALQTAMTYYEIRSAILPSKHDVLMYWRTLSTKSTTVASFISGSGRLMLMPYNRTARRRPNLPPTSLYYLTRTNLPTLTPLELLLLWHLAQILLSVSPYYVVTAQLLVHQLMPAHLL